MLQSLQNSAPHWLFVMGLVALASRVSTSNLSGGSLIRVAAGRQNFKV